MSIGRLVLRCLAVAAIQQNVDDAVSPTMAEDRVYDSRLDPLTLKQEEAKNIPCVVVYTDDDEGTQINSGSGGTQGPFKRVVELRIEISIGSLDSTAEGEGVTYGVPVTDPELEARLDLFEQQVKWALMSLPNRAYTNAFANYVVRLESIMSFAARDEGGNNRFSSRRLHLKCVINDDCPPLSVALPPGATRSVPADLDLSKFPGNSWLGQMIAALYNTPSLKPVIDALAGTGNPYAFIPMFKRFSMSVDAIGPEADPNLLAAQGKTHGPDGRIEVFNLVEIP